MGGRRKEEELSPHLDTVKANGLPGNHGGQHFLVSCQPDSWEHTPRLWPRRAWVDPTYLQIQALPPTRSFTSVFLLPNTGKTDLGEHPRHLQERNRRPLWSPTLSPIPMGSLSQVPHSSGTHSLLGRHRPMLTAAHRGSHTGEQGRPATQSSHKAGTRP